MTQAEISSTLKKEVPKHKHALAEKYKEEKLNQKDPLSPENIGNDTIDQLPTPSGWRILVLPFTPKDKTKGGILIAQETLDKLRIATNCGYVLKMGPLCYSEKKFTSGPWCKKGDWVIFARYAGSRLPIEGGEVRLLNDDEVLGTIKDPEAVLHHI
jgi:co-chaperonin GroES (HSP10)|tara:strand:- start:2477 stop:2944 length:468 start_codon:yes stop_codon:yes gene_type:complete